ncbi:MAG: hypothetical protein LBI84_05830 [Propionibacteriaceae bacterium]|jgi:hypothetical protein|nr:hypothetical protein [Propionibacteriaceae bacterium]
MSDITAILEELAAGRIDPAEAKRRIEAGQTDAPPPMPPDEASAEWKPASEPETAAGFSETPPPEPSPASWTRQGRAESGKAGAVERILVKAAGRRVKIVATPGVKQAMAEGIHQTKRRGNTLEISSEVELAGLGNAIGFLKSVRGLDDFKSLGLGQELTVHVNPDLALDLDIKGGSLLTTGVSRLGQVRLAAGAASLRGVEVVDDLVAQAGQVTVAGRFRAGLSRVRVESGQVTVKIAPDSDVTVTAESRLGHVSWDSETPHTDTTLVVGGGAARLNVAAVVGHVNVKVAAGAGSDDEGAGE